MCSVRRCVRHTGTHDCGALGAANVCADVRADVRADVCANIRANRCTYHPGPERRANCDFGSLPLGGH